MKRRENGQALIDFLLLLVVLIGIPLGLLFRYNVQLRNASVRAARKAAQVLRCRRCEARKAAPQCQQAAPAEKAKCETAPTAAPGEKAKCETAPTAAPAEKAKPATPAAPAAAPAK